MLPQRPSSDCPEGASPPVISIAELVARHHAELYGYAYRLTGSAADAEDLVQQAFLTAHENLAQLQRAESARAWLYTILRNAFLKGAQRQQRLPLGEAEIDLDSLPEVPLEDGIDRERLQAALNELPDEFRLVLLMFYFEDCSYREIAQRLDIPPGTVMSRLSRAKSHLRKKLFDQQALANSARQLPSAPEQS